MIPKLCSPILPLFLPFLLFFSPLSLFYIDKKDVIGCFESLQITLY